MPTKTKPLALPGYPTKKQIAVLSAIVYERNRQDQLVVERSLPFNLSDPMVEQGGDHALKLSILGEEFGEISKEVYELSVFESDADDPLLKLRTELPARRLLRRLARSHPTITLFPLLSPVKKL